MSRRNGTTRPRAVPRSEVIDFASSLVGITVPAEWTLDEWMTVKKAIWRHEGSVLRETRKHRLDLIRAIGELMARGACLLLSGVLIAYALGKVELDRETALTLFVIASSVAGIGAARKLFSRFVLRPEDEDVLS